MGWDVCQAKSLSETQQKLNSHKGILTFKEHKRRRIKKVKLKGGFLLLKWRRYHHKCFKFTPHRRRSSEQCELFWLDCWVAAHFLVAINHFLVICLWKSVKPQFIRYFRIPQKVSINPLSEWPHHAYFLMTRMFVSLDSSCVLLL